MDNKTAAMIMMSGGNSQDKSFEERYKQLRVLDTITVGDWTLELCDTTKILPELCEYSVVWNKVDTYDEEMNEIYLGEYKDHEFYKRIFSVKLKRKGSLQCVFTKEYYDCLKEYESIYTCDNKLTGQQVSNNWVTDHKHLEFVYIWRDKFQTYTYYSYDNSVLNVDNFKYEKRYNSSGSDNGYKLNFYWTLKSRCSFEVYYPDIPEFDYDNPKDPDYPIPVLLDKAGYIDSDLQVMFPVDLDVDSNIISNQSPQELSNVLRQFTIDFAQASERGEI